MFLRDYYVVGTKSGTYKIDSRRRPFFFREHLDFRTKDEISSSSENLRKFFCPIFNVLENHDLGKHHKIWAKLHCPPNFLGWYAYGHKSLSQDFLGRVKKYLQTPDTGNSNNHFMF